MKIAFLICSLLLTPLVYADPFVYLFDAGSTPYVPGHHTYDLAVDTRGLDWARSYMWIEIQTGSLWQFPFGSDRAPRYNPWDEFPESRWDTFVTAPGSFPNTTSAYDDIVTGTFDTATSGEFPLVWGDIPLDRDGPYALARLTVTDDFVGRIHGASWFSETGYQDYPFSFWIPEPGTLVGFALLVACAARRRGF